MAFKKGRKKTGGRKKGAKDKKTLEKELLLSYLTQKIIKGKGKWVPALLKSMEKGDIRAIKEGLDRVLGKATESVDITSDGERLDGINLLNIDLSKLNYAELVKLLTKKNVK
ncbi:MAG TPA: hypothetical protein ENH85_02925 [Candidatus Scalindua sp.]|nr:hypothetical protein [Candidatus Scalindua sp.]